MRKNKAFSFINIFGLSVGTLCCLYIMLYVKDQYSYDKHHMHAANIYRINNRETSTMSPNESNNATVVAPIAPLLKQNYPEVEQFTRVAPFLGSDEHLLHYKARALYEKQAVYVDSTFFDVFTYHFVHGNPLTALTAPNSIVLLKPTADKLFGKEDPVGKTITMENTEFKQDFTVTAVVDESLGKSHMHANIFITMNSGFLGDYVLHTDAWTRNGFIASYVKLRPDANVALLEKQFPAVVNRYGGDQLKLKGGVFNLYLQPVTTIHTTTGLKRYQPTKPVSPTFLTILLLIAILIQVVACINFMNLSTARAAKRAREVGVRKVAGARRSDLVKQFLGESFLLAFIGVLIALPLLLLLLPYLNRLTEADINLSLLKDLQLWGLLALLVIVTGFVAGSYPAFYLSTFRVVKVLKGNFTNHVSAAGIRRSLVVFQFVLSIVLITGIIVIYSQLQYIKHKDLGFDKNQQLVFSFHTAEAVGRLPAFISDLRQLAGVKAVSNANVSLSGPVFFSNGFFLNGEKDEQSRPVDFVVTDEHFITANGIRLASGRDFRPTDSSKALINETYAKRLGLTAATAVGTHLYDNQNRDAEIVGVMKDFNYTSLHNDVTGFLVWKQKPVDNNWPTLMVRTHTANYKALLAQIAAIWQKDLPGAPFSYSFLDDDMQRQYEAEITLSRIINSFTGMAILISCLGLFGLAAFSAEQRSKEIGIRKVLGASVPGIAQLLSKDFLKLVVIAFAIATPIAWWAMHQWLQEFAYRIQISWWMFALAGMAVIVIALLTVSFQAIKAAVANPIKSLRMD